MATSAVQQNVDRLCYEMLVQVRELASDSPAEAFTRYGVKPDDATRLRELTHEQIKAIASSGRLAFSLRLPKFEQVIPEHILARAEAS